MNFKKKNDRILDIKDHLSGFSDKIGEASLDVRLREAGGTRAIRSTEREGRGGKPVKALAAMARSRS